MADSPATKAAQRIFQREVAEGRLSTAPEIEDAFVAGWNGLDEYQKAKQALNYSQSSLMPLAMLLIIFGACMALMVGMLLYQQAPNLRDQAWLALPAGVAMVGLGIWCWIIANRRDARRLAEFRKEWSNDAQ